MRTRVLVALLFVVTGCSKFDGSSVLPAAENPGATSDGGAAGAPSCDLVDGAVPWQCRDGGQPNGPPTSPWPPPLHRPQAVACAPAQPYVPQDKQDPDYTIDTAICRSSADCAAGFVCVAVQTSHGPSSGTARTQCVHDDCTKDADCTGTAVCECKAGADGANRCLASTCRLDSDCEHGQYCAHEAGDNGSDQAEPYHCTSPADTCVPSLYEEIWDGCATGAVATWELTGAALTPAVTDAPRA